MHILCERAGNGTIQWVLYVKTFTHDVALYDQTHWPRSRVSGVSANGPGGCVMGHVRTQFKWSGPELSSDTSTPCEG